MGWYPASPSHLETVMCGRAERQASLLSMSTVSLQIQWGLSWMETVKFTKPDCQGLATELQLFELFAFCLFTWLLYDYISNLFFIIYSLSFQFPQERKEQKKFNKQRQGPTVFPRSSILQAQDQKESKFPSVQLQIMTTTNVGRMFRKKGCVLPS